MTPTTKAGRPIGLDRKKWTQLLEEEQASRTALDVERASGDATLREALAMLVAAASDTDRNMREADGHCIDCGRPEDMEHDDPDCGMAGLAVWAREARAALAAAQPAPEPLDVERLTAAMQHQRLGRHWDDFRKGYVSLWPHDVAYEYARLAAEEAADG